MILTTASCEKVLINITVLDIDVVSELHDEFDKIIEYVY